MYRCMYSTIWIHIIVEWLLLSNGVQNNRTELGSTVGHFIHLNMCLRIQVKGQDEQLTARRLGCFFEKLSEVIPDGAL